MAAASLTSWEEFLVFPDAPDGVHYELRDGEVIEVPLARPIHIVVQSLLVQILTKAAKAEEINRRRVVAFSCGTREFWLVDSERRTIEVSGPDLTTRMYGPGDSVPVSVIAECYLPVDQLFRD